uniref:Uncharacterized protein n=1 Tax=Hemiselmis andersenii TaxID=464988 RepID=A0A6U2G4V7_HEMAN|mmetsp:Transcript_34874/g.81752  ORF Transcript_34874/g.81752 Transcript_34874/m.81752 type:complete len:143 (+) Transcript_34874:252-680(+)
MEGHQVDPHGRDGSAAQGGGEEARRVLERRRDEVGKRWQALSCKLSPSIPVSSNRRTSLLLRRIQRREAPASHSRSGIARVFGAQGAGELRRMFRGLMRELDWEEQQELRDVLHTEALARGMHSYSISLRSMAPVSARAALC